MKKVIRKILNHFGYDIRKVDLVNKLHIAFTALMGTRERISVVQVGANDGVVNDPLYPMMRMFADRTRIVLIEPQRTLIPYLSKNYEFHPCANICSVAIGNPGILKLYAIKEEIWPRLNVPYATNWPGYRAPTGVTSANREHVRKWLERYFRGPNNIDEVIEELSVPCTPLLPLLSEQGWSDEQIDVLQIDAEGHDDDVIYACDIDRTKPRLIHFEWMALGKERQNDIGRYLETRGYSLYPNDADMLAIAYR